MAMPRTGEWYVVRIHHYAANGMRAPSIHKQLEADAEKAGRTDVPSLRTVARIVDSFEADVPLEDRRQQALFHWPGSMELGALPWQAGQAGLELMHWHSVLASKGASSGRPTVREVKWYYRLRLAAPDLPLGEAAVIALQLAWDEYAKLAKLSIQVDARRLDTWLALRAWGGPEQSAAYVDAIRREGLDALTTSSGMPVVGRGSMADFLEVVAAIGGQEATEHALGVIRELNSKRQHEEAGQ